MLVAGGVLLLLAAAALTWVGTGLGEQNAGDWAVILVTLAAGVAALTLGVYLARR